MVDEDRYCADILGQAHPARRALDGLEALLSSRLTGGMSGGSGSGGTTR